MKQRIAPALGPLLSVVLLTLAALVLRHEFQTYHLHDVAKHLRDIPARRLAFAVVLTVLGYLTLTGYDRLALRYVRTSLAYRRVALASFVAFVFSHNVGLSFFGGSAVRYRMLSGWGIRAEVIARVVAFSLLTFWLGFLVLGGVVHTVWPLPVDLSGIRLPSSRPLGVVLLLLLGAYIALVTCRRSPLYVRGFRVDLPGVGMTAVQGLLSSVDWLLAASVLYAVLPASPGLAFPVFVGAYLLGQIMGLVSHVPGGLGVFETAMVLLLHPYVPGDQVLASIVAYRIVYYLLPLVVAVLLFAGYEARQRDAQLRSASSFAQGWMVAIVPRLFAATTFLAGALLLLSGVTPELPGRLAWLRETLPLPLIEVSKLLGSVFGVLLLLLANALRQRIDAAFFGTLALLVGGVIVSLTKGLDWEEALTLFGMGIALLPCRRFFYRRSSLFGESLSPGWWLSLAVVALGSVFAFELAYRHVEYSQQLWWSFGFEAQAPRSLRATLAAGMALLGVGAARLLRPAPPVPDPPTSEELDRAQSIVARSTRVDGYLALLGDKQLMFSQDGDAFLMFGVSGRTWVAMGDPVGPFEQQEALAWHFRELADRHGARAVFYEVSDEVLPIYLELGFDLLKLGEAGRVSLIGFSLEGKHRSDLRQARRRMQREGYRFELLSPPEIAPHLDALQTISDEWLASKRTREKRFSLGFFDRGYLQRLPLAVVRRGDAILGFANLWPSNSKEECSVDLMRYAAGAPKGLMDFLFAELMLWARDNEYRWFSLGMAPLAGFETHRLAPLWNRFGALLFRYGEHFYNFRGLREFKDKFDPEWEPRYLAAPGSLATPVVLSRVAALVSGGFIGVVTR